MPLLGRVGGNQPEVAVAGKQGFLRELREHVVEVGLTDTAQRLQESFHEGSVRRCPRRKGGGHLDLSSRAVAVPAASQADVCGTDFVSDEDIRFFILRLLTPTV